MRVLYLVLGIFVLLLPGLGCAASDIGENDYFRVSKRVKTVEIGERKEKLLTLLKKYEATGSAAIRPGEVFAINLSVAGVGKLMEFGKKNEIAIVARVSERGADGGGFKFGSDAAESGRLIYFSDDVHENQKHSLSYIPMYGPVTYNGNPIDMQLYVIEMDEDIKQLKPLLHTLAKAGKNLYPPASPLLGLLDNLGSALLGAARNDMMFQYSFSLWPKSSDKPGYQHKFYPVLEAGHYVFMREANRKSTMDKPFKNLYLDAGDAELKRIVLKDGEKILERFKDDIYLVLHIKQVARSLSLDDENELYQTFAAFKQAEAKSKKKYVDQIVDDLQELGQEFSRSVKINAMYGLVESIDSASKAEASEAKKDAVILLSDLGDQIRKREACLQASPASPCTGVLAKRQIEDILAMLRVNDAFAAFVSKLTYDVLKTPDPVRDTKIARSVEEAVSGRSE